VTSRLATALIFVANGATIGTWIALIPAIQGSLGASGTELGFALLCGAAGALVAMPLTGQVLAHVSSHRVARGTALVFPLLAPLPLLAPSPAILALVMLLFGAANGAMDVSMNAHGVALERVQRRPLMSSLHAGWSLGGMLGAGAVALATAAGVDPLLEAAVAGVALWTLALLAGFHIGEGSLRSAEGRGLRLPSRRVLPIGALAVLIALVEGGMNDWSGIFLRQDLEAPPELAASAYAALALGMTVGRLGGDVLNVRLGAVGLLRWGQLLVTGALAVVLLVQDPVIALGGLVVAGVGVANGLPLLFAAGGRVPPAGPSLSAVFTIAYLAFLAGPPLIGAGADTLGLPIVLAMLGLLSVVIAAAAGRVPGLDRPSSLGRAEAEPEPLLLPPA
jgi:hypothetical protein